MPICLNQREDNPCTLRSSLSGEQHSEVRIHNFGFNDLYTNRPKLPGEFLVNLGCHNGNRCDSQCLEVYNNVSAVTDFINSNSVLFTALEFYEFSINVLYYNNNDRVFEGALCIPKSRKICFGQRLIDGKLYSCGTDITIVAHEICHGLIYSYKQTNNTEDKTYEVDALEESLCDIFSILFCNYNKTSIQDWQWEIGQGIFDNPLRIRNFKYPLSSFSGCLIQEKSLSFHDLSLIHSHAFYLFMTKQEEGNYLFDGNSEFALQLLISTIENFSTYGNFSDSRRAFERNARILLQGDSSQELKLQAISDAFDQVGIQ